jgi:hypothetical protein
MKFRWAHLIEKFVSTSRAGLAATQAAWKTIPSWFIFGSLDKNITDAAHEFMAQRANAKATVDVKGASHVVMVSHPDAVTALIEKAEENIGGERERYHDVSGQKQSRRIRSKSWRCELTGNNCNLDRLNRGRTCRRTRRLASIAREVVILKRMESVRVRVILRGATI